MKILLILLFHPGWLLNLVVSAPNTDAPSLAGSGLATENAPVVIVQDAGVQTSDDDVLSIAPIVAEEVEETSKALELPDLDDNDSDYGSDYEFS